MPEFSNPFAGLVPRKMTRQELARAIMFDIAAELEAINIYQAHLEATDDELAKAVLAHVRNEEQEHTAQFLTLLEHLDPEMAERMRGGNAEIAEVMAQVQAGAPAEEAAEAGEGAGEAARTVPEPLSVGDLRG